MPKCKLLVVPKEYYYYKSSAEFQVVSTTDWDILTDSELTLLQENLDLLPKLPYNREYAIIQTLEADELRPIVEQLKIDASQRAEIEKKKKEEAAEKRRKTLENKRLKEERAEKKQLKALLQKYGGNTEGL